MVLYIYKRMDVRVCVMRTPASYRYRYKYKYVYINRMRCHVRSKRKETFKTHNVRFGFIEWGNLWELNSKHYGRIVILLLRVSNVHIHVYIGKCKQAGSQASRQAGTRISEWKSIYVSGFYLVLVMGSCTCTCSYSISHHAPMIQIVFT